MTETPGPFYTSSLPQYPAAQRQPPRPEDKRMASWALGLSLVPCLLSLVVALVLALVVLFHHDDGVDHGKRRAGIALGLIAVWVLIGVVGLVVVNADRAPRDDRGRVTAGGSLPVLDLEVGDCLEDAVTTGETYAVDVVPCGERHRAEVYATFDLEGTWSGRASADRATEAGCLQRFEGYVGERLRRSELEVLFFQPVDAASFRQDPGVICMAQSASDTTGSVRGSGGGQGSVDPA